MGLGIMSSSCGCYKSPSSCNYENPEPRAGNPEPLRFQIVSTTAKNDFVIAEVVYPDCHNYEGRKILVFQGVKESKIKSLSFLDPHFCEGEHISPIARFEPTNRGRYFAERMVERH